MTRAKHGGGAKKGWVQVSIAEIERRTGRTFTREQIERVATAGAQQRPAVWKAKVNVVRVAPDQAVIDRALRQRDRLWLFWHRSPSLQIQFPLGPPLTIKSLDDL